MADPRLARLLADATELVRAKRFRDAAAAYAVAADLAEELGERDVARLTRTNARRYLVVDWAQRRWPAEGISADDVGRRWRHPEDVHKEEREFAVRRSGLASRWIVVSVSRRGRVTILKRQS